MPSKLTHDIFVERTKKSHPNLEILTPYEGADKEITVRCNFHNFVYRTTPHRLKSGLNCQKCYDERRGDSLRMTPQQLLIKFRSKHGYKYKYPYLEEEYTNNKSKITIVCLVHGEFKMTSNKHLAGQGCPVCAIEKNAIDKRLTQEEFVQKSNLIHHNKYDYSLTKYIKWESPVAIICPKHGKFIQVAGEHLSGCGCSKCHQSHLEGDIDNILSVLKIENIPQYRNKKVFGRKSFDFFLPQYKICIECQGGQHFGVIERYKSSFKEILNRDILKKREAESQGWNMLYVTNRVNKQYLDNEQYEGLYDKKHTLFIEDIRTNHNLILEKLVEIDGNNKNIKLL